MPLLGLSRLWDSNVDEDQPPSLVGVILQATALQSSSESQAEEQRRFEGLPRRWLRDGSKASRPEAATDTLSVLEKRAHQRRRSLWWRCGAPPH